MGLSHVLKSRWQKLELGTAANYSNYSPKKLKIYAAIGGTVDFRLRFPTLQLAGPQSVHRQICEKEVPQTDSWNEVLTRDEVGRSQDVHAIRVEIVENWNSGRDSKIAGLRLFGADNLAPAGTGNTSLLHELLCQ